jgi:hypothetical protein
MGRRFSNYTGLAVLVAAALLSIPVLGQAPVQPKAKAPAKAPEKKWVAPKTPWGDPDLQGWFTNLAEDGTPLERPDQFAGRRLEDIKGEELAAIKRASQQRTLTEFAGPLHAPEHFWQDDLNLEKGSQAWLVVDPPDGKIPPLTPEAQQRTAQRNQARRAAGRGPSDSYEDRSLYDRCITRGLPGSMMPVIYGNSYQILQSPGYVMIGYEMVHEMRVIPIGAAPHSGPTMRSYMGDARGHWEGDTLVVETTNFREDGIYRNANPATLRLIEKFTRTGPTTVKWSVTVDDLSTWTKPWTFSMPLTKDDSQPVLEYACHEGNLGLRDILSSARAEEKKAAEDAARK